MVGHGGSSASSYLADPTSPIPSHCASIVVTSTLRVKHESELPVSHHHYDFEFVPGPGFEPGSPVYRCTDYAYLWSLIYALSNINRCTLDKKATSTR